MAIKVGIVAAAAVLLTAITANASAASSPVRPVRVVHDADIELTLVDGVPTPTGTWYTHWAPLRFSIDVTNSGTVAEDGVEVAVRVPDTVDLRVDGDGWDCQDMDGGVSCAIEQGTAAGEAWPTLDAEINFKDSWGGDATIFVSARPGLNGTPEPGENELEQNIYLDTSI